MSVGEKKKRKPSRSKRTSKNDDISASYNKFKEFEGKQYSGMKVGRSHKWYYDKGEWKEKRSRLICGKFLTRSPNEEQEEKRMENG